MEKGQMNKMADIMGYNSDYKINLVPGTPENDGLNGEQLRKIESLNGVKNLSAI